MRPTTIVACSSNESFASACMSPLTAQAGEYDVQLLTAASFGVERGRHKLQSLGPKAAHVSSVVDWVSDVQAPDKSLAAIFFAPLKRHLRP
jgi:hypothetical protein